MGTRATLTPEEQAVRAKINRRRTSFGMPAIPDEQPFDQDNTDGFSDAEIDASNAHFWARGDSR